MASDAPITTAKGLVIPIDALTWRTSRSGGPGGQHVNTSDTRVELVCDISACGFDRPLTDRLVTKIGPMVRIVSTEHRSQLRNRTAAAQRLAELLDAASVVPKRRRPTRPSRSSDAARLETKKRDSRRKSERAWRPGSD